MKRRRELIENKTLKNAYVKFPAQLMGKKDGKDSYELIEDFSQKGVLELAVLVNE